MSDDDRLSGPLDAVLHLLDRQVVDTDGLLVCKVDDVELTTYADGALGVSGLLAGPAALVPRLGDEGLGRWLHTYWLRLGRPEADHDDPCRIDLDLVRHVRSGVELSVGREGVLVRRGQRGHRLNDVLQMKVLGPDGTRLGRVLDVRLEREAEHPGRRLRVIGLVIGRGRPGSYLGYDRNPDMGPWLVNRVVRALHRHSAYVSIDNVDLGWESRVAEVATEDLRSLATLHDHTG